MPAVRLRFRAELRERWRWWLAMAALAGVAGGLVIAVAAASHRTATAYPRFLTATRGADVYVDPGFVFGSEDLDLSRIARLPQVAATELSAQLAVLSRSRSGTPIHPAGAGAVSYTVPVDDRPYNRIDRLALLRGRSADPDRPDEALADSRAARALGVGVGDTLSLRLLDHDRLWKQTETIHLTADPRTSRVGPLATVRIVGVVANAKTSVDASFVYLTRGFYHAHGGPALGSWLIEMATRLKRSDADLDAFRSGVARIAGERSYGFFESREQHPKVQHSLDFQAHALRLLAAIAAAAALLLIGQAMLRQAVVDSRGQATLRALGMTRGQLLALGALRAAAIAAPAAALATLVALGASPLTPFGWARELEPHPGFAFDAPIVGAGAAAVLGFVLLGGLLGAVRVTARGAERAARASGRSSVAAVLARAGLPPAVAAGVRMALLQRGSGTAVPVRATLGSAILAVGVAVTALTFASSLQHLLDTPRLYGQAWDFEVKGFGPAVEDDLVRNMVRDPALRDVAVGLNWPVQIAGRKVGVDAMDAAKGSVARTVLEGRAPRAPDEALFGTKTLDQLHLRIGDTVVARSGDRSVRLRIVGRGVIPAYKWNELGEGAAFSFRTLKRIVPEAAASGLEIAIAPGADRAAALARLRVLLDGPNGAVVPTDVADFGGVSEMPAIIAALFALAAAAALAHALLTSIRRRRGDLAVLKTLGFTRRQVVAAVTSQAMTIAAIGLLAGVPLGLAVGRFTWNVVAASIGVVPEAVTPIAPTLLVVPAAVLLAILIAALPARIAARTRPAVVLRAE